MRGVYHFPAKFESELAQKKKKKAKKDEINNSTKDFPDNDQGDVNHSNYGTSTKVD